MTGSLPYRQDLRHCFDLIEGIDRQVVETWLDQTRAPVARLREAVGTGEYAFLDQPDRIDDLAAIRKTAEALSRFPTVVLLGTGGSSLGARTLAALADGGTGMGAPGRPRLIVAENVDPYGFERLAAAIDWKNAGLLIVSKSGGTGETLAQAHALLGRLPKPAEQAWALTEPTDNPLARLAKRHGIPCLDHPTTLGGRFSVLSAVGLVPAAILGLDIEALRAGAKIARDHGLADPLSSAPAWGAALAAALNARGIRTSVLCPYVDALAAFGQWYVQLWAESLGKGGHGTTPMKALGTVDQHSQLQLWLDGPADKLVTILARETKGVGHRYAAADLADPALDWLEGRTMGDLLDVSWRATAETLARRGRPVRLLTLPTLDERTLGALFMHFELETVIAASLFDVEPFDQPAVEDGKRLARSYLKGMA
ncbi:MAG: glucose-6-phosphate isomerase [Tagaea sp.]|nr:glucose-6-phosphate isomerase [Tagaea sp.]